MSKNTGYERFMVPSIHDIPGVQAKAAFLNVNSSSVFREQDIEAQPLGDHEYYMPWGMDNAMPYNIMDLIESDETVSTCLMWNSQMCYGSGLQYNTEKATKKVEEKKEAPKKAAPKKAAPKKAAPKAEDAPENEPKPKKTTRAKAKDAKTEE